jgi:Mg-chelatase subunit ChlD/uncharacterized membrane protein
VSFAHPWWLLLLGLSLLVLLFHARRRKRLPISSVMLWESLVSDAARDRSLRPPRLTLPLLLQLLALALLVFAIARPLLGRAAGSSEHVVLLVDASASMGATDVAPTRFERALSLAADRASNLADQARFSLVVVGHEPHVAGARLTGRGAREAVTGLVTGTANADWREAARLAAGLVRPGERTDLLVVSDAGGASEASSALSAELPGLTVDFETLGGDAPNVGFVAAELQPPDEERDTWLVTGELLRTAAAGDAVEIEASFEPAGSKGALPWASLAVEFDGEAQAGFEMALELPGPGALELRLPRDRLEVDDRAYLVVGNEPRTARVLQVGADNPLLTRALQAVPDVELFRSSELPEDSAGFDLVILDGVEPESETGTHTIHFPGANGEPGQGAPLRPTGWRSEHPLMGALDWGALSIDPGAVSGATSVLPGATALLEAGGRPLLQLRTSASGYEIAASFAPANSNWPSQPSFPLFLSRLLAMARPDLGQGPTAHCLTGRRCPWPLEREGTLLDPTGQAVATGQNQSFQSGFVPVQPGFHRTVDGSGTRLLAVNAFHSAESALDLAAGNGAAERGNGSEPRPGWATWRWLVLAAFLVMAAEALAAGLGTERFLRLPSLAAANPLSGRHRWSLALHVATLALLVLALFDPSLPVPASRGDVVVVLDDPAFRRAEADERSRELLAALRQRAGRIGIVTLGRRSAITYDLGAGVPQEFRDSTATDGDGGETQGPSARAAGGQSAETRAAEGNEAQTANAPEPGANLESALRLAAGMLAGSSEGRIVVLGSGMETSGEASAAVQELIAANVPVDVLPIGGLAPGEVLVEEVFAAGRPRAGRPFPLQTLLHSESPVDADVRTYRDGELLTERQIRLRAGANRVETLLSEEDAGSYLFETAVEAQSDVFPENNRAGVYVEVLPPPAVLLVTPQVERGEPLANALEVHGIETEVVEPFSAPWNMNGWLEYSAVILQNVPAIDLHSMQQGLLERWVREHGGGLLVLGGENTFGPGGYYQTPLEDMSPLSSRVPREAPVVAMLFVLDRSGSMQQKVGDVNRLQIAKEATAQALDLLSEESVAGIVAFDSVSTVLVPMQPLVGKERFITALESLGASGGTSIYPALEQALEEMAGVEAPTRHVVVMTDGLSQPGDFASLMEQFQNLGISVSTVAIGRGADTVLLQGLARQGGGTFHATADFQALPSILAQEALMLSGTPLEETTFVPIATDEQDAFLSELPEPLPPLHGYVLTTAKPEANVNLYASAEDPLLATWRYGLGRVLAFASHGAGEWSRDWLAMPEFPLLWAQAVTWALPETAPPGLDLRMRRSGDRGLVIVEALGKDGLPAEGLAVVVDVTAPGETEPTSVRLTNAGGGRYLGEISVERPGPYRLRAHVGGTGDQSASPGVARADAGFEPVERSVHVSYPGRFAFGDQDSVPLLEVSRATGGALLFSPEDLPDGGARRGAVGWRMLPAWPLLLGAALMLFLAALAVRYLPRRRSRKSAGSANPRRVAGSPV